MCSFDVTGSEKTLLVTLYSLEKSGCLLKKKRSFGRFPSLGENRNKQGDLAILLIKIAKKQGQFVATRLTWPKRLYLFTHPGV